MRPGVALCAFVLAGLVSGSGCTTNNYYVTEASDGGVGEGGVGEGSVDGEWTWWFRPGARRRTSQ